MGRIDKVEESGDVWYEVVLIKGGQERNFQRMAGRQVAQLPGDCERAAPALRAVRAQMSAGKGIMGEIDLVMDEGKITYEVEAKKDDKDVSFCVASAGKLLWLEVALADTPDAVQKKIKEMVGGGVITSLVRDNLGTKPARWNTMWRPRRTARNLTSTSIRLENCCRGCE